MKRVITGTCAHILKLLLNIESWFIIVFFVAGHGSMGISNSIGSNTFDILLCLGLPWLIKAIFFPINEGENFVQINSGGMSYSVISLFATLFLLYVIFMYYDYKLDYKVGLIFIFIYIVFLIIACLLELNIFFPVNLPVCDRGY